MGSMLLEDSLNTYSCGNAGTVAVSAGSLLEVVGLNDTGARMQVELALSTASGPLGPLYIARGTIPASNDPRLSPVGNMRKMAILKDLDTSAAGSVGDPVYVSESFPGGLAWGSAFEASASHPLKQVGVVLKVDAALGQVFLWPSYFIQKIAGAGATTLDGLTDTLLSSPALGDVLRHDGVRWVDAALDLSIVTGIDAGTGANQAAVWDGAKYTGVALDTSYLSDIDLSGIAAGQYVSWSGTQLVATSLPSIPATISDLSDVDTSGVSNGDHLVFNSGSGNWEASTTGAIPSALNDLSDCDTTSTSPGHVLRNVAGVFTSQMPVLDYLSDVDTAGVSSGDALVYDGGSAEFKARPAYDVAVDETEPSGTPGTITTGSPALVNGMTTSYSVVHGGGDSEVHITASYAVSASVVDSVVTSQVFYAGVVRPRSEVKMILPVTGQLLTVQHHHIVGAGDVGSSGAKTIEIRAAISSGTGTIEDLTRLLLVKEVQIP
jgi:hypothetical protein